MTKKLDEGERVQLLKNFLKESPGNEDLEKIVQGAIDEGTSPYDNLLITKISVAIRDGKLSAEDLEAMELMDMSPEDYRRYNKEAEQY